MLEKRRLPLIVRVVRKIIQIINFFFFKEVNTVERKRELYFFKIKIKKSSADSFLLETLCLLRFKTKATIFHFFLRQIYESATFCSNKCADLENIMFLWINHICSLLLSLIKIICCSPLEQKKKKVESVSFWLYINFSKLSGNSF